MQNVYDVVTTKKMLNTFLCHAHFSHMNESNFSEPPVYSIRLTPKPYFSVKLHIVMSKIYRYLQQCNTTSRKRNALNKCQLRQILYNRNRWRIVIKTSFLSLPYPSLFVYTSLFFSSLMFPLCIPSQFSSIYLTYVYSSYNVTNLYMSFLIKYV